MASKQSNELIIYTGDNPKSPVHIAFDGDTMWLTQEEIAALFDTSGQNIGQHIKNIYKDDELASESTSKKIFGVVENLATYR